MMDKAIMHYALGGSVVKGCQDDVMQALGSEVDFRKVYCAAKKKHRKKRRQETRRAASVKRLADEQGPSRDWSEEQRHRFDRKGISGIPDGKIKSIRTDGVSLRLTIQQPIDLTPHLKPIAAHLPSKTSADSGPSSASAHQSAAPTRALRAHPPSPIPWPPPLNVQELVDMSAAVVNDMFAAEETSLTEEQFRTLPRVLEFVERIMVMVPAASREVV